MSPPPTTLRRYQIGPAALEVLAESTRYHTWDAFLKEFRRRHGQVCSKSTYEKQLKILLAAGDQARAAVPPPAGKTPSRRRGTLPAPDYATTLEHVALVAELAQMAGGVESIAFMLDIQQSVGGPGVLRDIIGQLGRFHGLESVRRAPEPPLDATRNGPLPESSERTITPQES